MENPFRDDGVSDADLEAELKSEYVTLGQVKLAEKAASYWRRIAPEDSGEYKDSIIVVRNGPGDVDVIAADEKANMIEFGTEDTPEFGCRAQVQAKFKVSEGE